MENRISHGRMQKEVVWNLVVKVVFSQWYTSMDPQILETKKENMPHFKIILSITEYFFSL